ncbi:MAG: hypothetical protein ABIJ30_09015, partial [bacterium]
AATKIPHTTIDHIVAAGLVPALISDHKRRAPLAQVAVTKIPTHNNRSYRSCRACPCPNKRSQEESTSGRDVPVNGYASN